jgi:hypothetical protein
MSARTQGLSIILVSVATVACSQPRTDSGTTAHQAASVDPVPTLEPLVSALESGQRTELTLVRPAEKKPPQPVLAKAPGESPGAARVEAHNHAAELGDVTPAVTSAALAPASEAPMAPAMAPAPAGPALGSGDGDGVGAGDGARDPVLFPDRGPGTIIIRGGMGGVYDDCKNHPQGYPAGGIAINNRMPQVGSPGVMASNPSQRPFTPGRMGGTGGIGVPRRGIR